MKWPLLFWFMLVAPGALRADESLDRVLAHVPDQAGLVIITPSLDKLVGGLGELGSSIEVSALRELSPARLLNDLDVLERTDGLDSAGPFLLALSPNGSSPLLVCQVRDAELWRQSAKAQPVESNLWRLLIFGEPAYAGFDGNLLVVGDEPETVRAALGTGSDFTARFGPRARAWLADNQLVIAIRVSEWTSFISPALNAARASVQISMMIAGQQDETMLALIGWLFERTAGLVDQVETYTAAVRVGPEALFFRDALSFKPDSYAADYLKKIVKTQRNLLRGLPDDENVFVFAYEWELQPGTESLTAQMLEALFASGQLRQRLGEEKFEPGYRALLASNNASHGSCTAVTTAATEPLLLFSGIQFSPSPQEMLRHTRVAYETAPEFIGALGGGANVEVDCRSEQIGSTDTFACRLSFTTPDEQARRLIDTIYGPTMATYYAAHPQGVAYTTGSAERAAAQLQRLLSGEARPLAENSRVREACGRLSPHPQMLVLLDASRGLELALRIVKLSSAGPAVPEISARAAPLIVYGGYVDGTELSSELCVPTEPVKLIITTARSLKQSSPASAPHKR